MHHSKPGHTFHVPVMGTGFTIDAPLRIGKFGISSVVSLVDDNLIEKVRRRYARSWNLPYTRIPAHSGLDRASRITAYFDLITDILQRQIAEIKALPFGAPNDKAKYFNLLPESSSIKQLYMSLETMADPILRSEAVSKLNNAILPGRIGCNIMTKLDAVRCYGKPNPITNDLSDAKSALKGFAESKCEGDVVLSAGVNPTLFGLLEQFNDFYPDESGYTRKRIILKVSDVRSSLVQGKLLAKKGVRVAEFRIESGLNCGGHAFATEGLLMGPLLAEFREQRSQFDAIFEPMIAAYCAQHSERRYQPRSSEDAIRITAQGGLGNAGEAARIMEYFGLDGTGWATPFLLVPEATSVDQDTRNKLAQAKSSDLVVSNASPLGIPFNNLRTSSSETWSESHIANGNPGSPCPNGYVRFNTEFEGMPLCVSSHEYMIQKLKALGYDTPPTRENASPEVQAMYDKRCICCHLGNGTLIELGLARPGLPVAVCPGPNLAYFNRTYSLVEMVDHIYGRGPSLVPEDRPHMFAKELVLYVEHLEKLVATEDFSRPKTRQSAQTFINNLNHAIEFYRALVKEPPYPFENLESLRCTIDEQALRLAALDIQIQAACMPKQAEKESRPHGIESHP